MMFCHNTMRDLNQGELFSLCMQDFIQHLLFDLFKMLSS